MNGSMLVSREELHRELDRLREIITHLREMSDRSEAAQAKALSLQAREYERRLAELNTVHEHALQAQRETVPREVFDHFVSSFAEWKDTINQEIALNKGASANSARYFSNVVIIVGLVFGALTLLLRLFGP